MGPASVGPRLAREQNVLYLLRMPRLSARPLLDNTVDGDLFADRRQELARLRQALGAQFNSVVVGPAGSGKTSLLRRLAFCLRQDGVAVTFLDGGAARSAAELLDVLREQLFGLDVVRVSAMTEQLTRVFGRAQVRQSETAQLLDLVAALRDGYADQERATAAAEQERARGAYVVEEPERAPRVVLLDGLPSSDVGHTLFGRLRDELWTVPLCWIVAVREADRAAVLRPPASAFFETQLSLQPLDPAAALELLRRRLDHGDDVAEDLLAATVAHSDLQPRALIAALRANLDSHESPQQRAQRRAELLRRLEETGGRPAVMLAAELQALGGASASDEALLQRLGWTRARTSKLLHQLAQAGLLNGSEQRGESGGRPRRVYQLVDPGL